MAAHSALTHRTVSGLLWTAWGKGGHAVLTLLALVVLARLLTPAEFGTVSAALVIIEFSSIFSRLGVGPAVVQRQQLEPRHLRAAFSGSLLLGLVTGGAIWLLAPWAAGFFNNAGVEPVLRVFSCVFPLRGISAVAESLMLRDLRFRWLANLEVVTFAAAQGLVGIPLALAGYGVWALVGSVIAQTVARSAALLAARRSPFGLWPEWAALRDLLHFGSGFTLARLANQLALQGDNLVVGHSLGAAALGVYGRAYGLMATPASALGKVLDDVLFPTMARVQDDVERLRRAYRRGVAVIALVALPASVLLAILAPEVIAVALGPQWGAAILPFRILAAGAFFRTSYKMSDSLARSTGVVFRRAGRQVVYAGMVLGGAYVGQHWGLGGVAAGVFLALMVNFLLMAQLSLEVCRMTWGSFWAAHAPGLLLAGVGGAITWLVATALREAGLSPVSTLAVSAGSAAAGTLWLAYRYPRPCLGEEGLWTLEAVRTFVAKSDWYSRAAVTRARLRGSA